MAKGNWRTCRLLLILLVFCSFAPGPRPIWAGTVAPVNSAASRKYVRTELYFGMARTGGASVTEAEFQRFIDEFVTPRFPEGLTVVDAQGQWRESDSSVTKERTKVLILIYQRKVRRIAAAKIEEIRSEYKKRFDQSSVMRVDLGKSLEVSF